MVWLTDMYWQVCQYPWHLFVNIGLALVLYMFATRFGPPVRRYAAHLFRVHTVKANSFFLFLLDITIFYLLASIAIALALMPVLLQKGIGFNFLGYSFYFWFLLFPMHSTVRVIRGKWATAGGVFVLAMSIALLVIFVLSVFWFPNHIIKKHLEFRTTKISQRVRIVHLSDMHCERYGLREKNMIRMVNELDPDIIVVSGDIFIRPFRFNMSGYHAAVKILERINVRYGIYVVEGHHDFGVAHHLVSALSGKVNLLDAEWIHFNDHKINLSIAGFSPSGKLFDYQEGKVAGNFRIFLAHSPSLTVCLRRTDFDLALFGHTHGGQVYIPIVTELILGRFIHGLYTAEKTPIYVNSGIGLEGFLAPRIRWFSYPEIVAIDLVPEK